MYYATKKGHCQLTKNWRHYNDKICLWQRCATLRPLWSTTTIAAPSFTILSLYFRGVQNKVLQESAYYSSLMSSQRYPISLLCQPENSDQPLVRTFRVNETCTMGSFSKSNTSKVAFEWFNGIFLRGEEIIAGIAVSPWEYLLWSI